MFVGYVDRNGYGYTFDGKKIGQKLCDENSEPVMRDGESIIVKRCIEYDIDISGKIFGKELLYKYEGVFYKTNQRLIGVREPKAWEGVMRKGFELPTPVNVADAWRTKEVAKAGGKEYFELFLNEIIRCKKSWGVVFIDVPVKKGKKYRLRVIPPKDQRKSWSVLDDLLTSSRK